MVTMSYCVNAFCIRSYCLLRWETEKPKHRGATSGVLGTDKEQTLLISSILVRKCPEEAAEVVVGCVRTST